MRPLCWWPGPRASPPVIARCYPNGGDRPNGAILLCSSHMATRSDQSEEHVAATAKQFVVEADPRGRVSLARAGKLAERYLCYALADGRIILQPAAVVSELELNLLGDPDAVARLDERPPRARRRCCRRTRLDANRSRRDGRAARITEDQEDRRVSTSTPQRTFRKPSSATLAPLGGRPIAIRWLASPEEDALDIPPDVDLAASYSGVALDDGRIILTPTGEPLERVDANAQPATKKVASASKTDRSTPVAHRQEGVPSDGVCAGEGTRRRGGERSTANRRRVDQPRRARGGRGSAAEADASGRGPGEGLQPGCEDACRCSGVVGGRVDLELGAGQRPVDRCRPARARQPLGWTQARLRDPAGHRVVRRTPTRSRDALWSDQPTRTRRRHLSGQGRRAAQALPADPYGPVVARAYSAHSYGALRRGRRSR